MTPHRSAIVVAVAWILLLVSGAATFVDPDAWHLMALAREALALGYMPLTDRFAYTPTVAPVVQHEWGSGMLLYFLALHGGTTALQIARAVLLAIFVAGAWRVARLRGATSSALAVLAPPAAVMSWIGITALRPQMVTLAFLALWLVALERDRHGDRRWIAPVLVGHVAWLNMHAGFVVGMAFLVLHAAEQAVRGRPFAHVVGVVVAMAMLVSVNPYGRAYYTYLAHALTMARPLIGEWQPIWRANPIGFGIYAATLAIAVVALGGTGIVRATGWPVLAASAYLAASHERHVSIYALAWFAYVPGWVASTPAGKGLQRFWERPSSLARTTIAVTALALGTSLLLIRHPWRLSVPGTTPDGAPAPYPVGPVAYLQQHDVRANLLVPFAVGAFVSWKLHPRVKVSIDSRYEVAYPPELLPAHLRFFAARPQWREFLGRFATDLVLVPASSPIAEVMATETPWNVAYRDDAYLLFARPGLSIPPLDRRGQHIVGTFP